VKIEETNGDIMVRPQPKLSQTTIRTERSTSFPKETEEETSSYSSFTLAEKQKVEGTETMTFKFTKDGLSGIQIRTVCFLFT
jgi:hypothetical protein